MIFIVSGTQTSTYDSLIISYLPVYIPSKVNMTKINILFRGAGDKTLDLAHIKEVKYHLICVLQNHIFYHLCVLWVDSRLTPCLHSLRQCHSLFIRIAETAVISSAVPAVTQPTVCVSTVYSIWHRSLDILCESFYHLTLSYISASNLSIKYMESFEFCGL